MPPRTYFTSQRHRQQVRLRSTMTVPNTWSGTVTQQITIKKEQKRFSGKGNRLGGRNVGRQNSRIRRQTARMEQAVRDGLLPAARNEAAREQPVARPPRSIATLFDPRPQAANPTSPPEEPEATVPSSPGSFQVQHMEVLGSAAYVLADMGGTAVDGGQLHALEDVPARYRDAICGYNREHHIGFSEEVYARCAWLAQGRE